jgi:hypothetical protein
VTVAAIIADRLESESFADAIKNLTEEVLLYRPDQRAAADHVSDVIRLVGTSEARRMISRFLITCFPAQFAQRDHPDTATVIGGEGLGWFYLGYEMTKEAGEQMQRTGFSDWWWEWNGELDDDFFHWLDTLGASSYGPGDFPPPAPGGGLPA